MFGAGSTESSPATPVGARRITRGLSRGEGLRHVGGQGLLKSIGDRLWATPDVALPVPQHVPSEPSEGRTCERSRFRFLSIFATQCSALKRRSSCRFEARPGSGRARSRRRRRRPREPLGIPDPAGPAARRNGPIAKASRAEFGPKQGLRLHVLGAIPSHRTGAVLRGRLEALEARSASRRGLAATGQLGARLRG